MNSYAAERAPVSLALVWALSMNLVPLLVAVLS